MNDELEAIDGLCAKIIEQRDRIEALEADLAQWVRQAEDNSGGWQRAGLRIEALEAALRELAHFPVTNKNHAGTQMMKIARAALEQDK